MTNDSEFNEVASVWSLEPGGPGSITFISGSGDQTPSSFTIPAGQSVTIIQVIGPGTGEVTLDIGGAYSDGGES
ncbi:MAG TPA: hypothetical protein VMD59_21725, partial [Acidimicrobiales bacterium]|nr:hypothetical protein [Acidimicrobiales bacterium]